MEEKLTQGPCCPHSGRLISKINDSDFILTINELTTEICSVEMKFEPPIAEMDDSNGNNMGVVDP